MWNGPQLMTRWHWHAAMAAACTECWHAADTLTQSVSHSDSSSDAPSPGEWPRYLRDSNVYAVQYSHHKVFKWSNSFWESLWPVGYEKLALFTKLGTLKHDSVLSAISFSFSSAIVWCLVRIAYVTRLYPGGQSGRYCGRRTAVGSCTNY